MTAFVSPKWVPQMGDASEVFAGITRKPGVRYSALVPNRAGLDRAMAAGVAEIAMFAAASETFSRRNINQSIDESFATYRQVTDAALRRPRCVRGRTCPPVLAVRSKARSIRSAWSTWPSDYSAWRL